MHFPAPSIDVNEQRRIDQTLQKSALEAKIKDNMITRDLKFQETVITSRFSKQSQLAADAVLVKEDGKNGRYENSAIAANPSICRQQKASAGKFL